MDVGAGRTHAQVCALFERLAEPDRVEAVSMDMSLVFREAVRLCLPQAQIVADHFHVVQHVGKALSRVVRRVASSPAGRSALKGRGHLFLRPQDALTPEQEDTRADLAVLFPEAQAAWQHKEALRHWYATATTATATLGLDTWMVNVEREGPSECREMLAAFRTWREEILAFFLFLPTRISNGFVEGKNNRTKALMRQAYGYRNRRHLRLHILLGAA